VPKEFTFDCLVAADKLNPLFIDMNWCVVKPRHGFFITSDNPVVRWIDPHTGDGGFYNKTVKVTFPLSPRLLLRLSWEKVPRSLLIERDHVERVNRKLAAHSERYLYAHVHDKRLQRLAAEFKDRQAPRRCRSGVRRLEAGEVRRDAGAKAIPPFLEVGLSVGDQGPHTADFKVGGLSAWLPSPLRRP
jgi:hypothetical protein